MYFIKAIPEPQKGGQIFTVTGEIRPLLPDVKLV